MVQIDGEDNVARAIAWSRVALPDAGASVVLLGRDDVFADSLASGGAQGILDAPLLLTGAEALDPRVSAELDRLGADRVVLLGGPAAVSDQVAEQLAASGLAVERLQGATRIETAIAIADSVAAQATTAVLARAYPDAQGEDPGRAFADALAAGALAAERDLPLLLTETGQLSASTAAYLAASTISEVIVVGGVAAVSDLVVSDLEALGVTVTRVAGDSRFATATALAAERGAVDASAADASVLVDGEHPDAWADAFPAALYAGSATIPIVLAAGDTLPPPTAEYLDGRDTLLVCGTTITAAGCTAAADLGSR